jgi:glycosyltransferase involved in cell wall biosynthesis
MRVALAVPDFEPAVGGTVRHGGLIARGLVRRGHDVVVVTRRRDRSWPRREHLEGLPVERIGPAGAGRLGEVGALVSLAWWLWRRRARLDVVQALMWPDAATAAAAAGLAARTVVAWGIRGEVAGALGPRRRIGGRLLVGLRGRHAARCTHVTLTPSMDAELAEAGLVTRAVRIPVPIDTQAFRPPDEGDRALARVELNLAPEAFTVCYVGHLERRKAVERLVEAFAKLLDERSGARLLLVGGGRRGVPEDTEPALRGLVVQLGLEDAVRFCGVQPDPRPFLRAADVFVLPSFREGMPNALLEAMASGLPCVAPASAGGDEVIDAETGIVPPSNAPEDLLSALRALAGYPGRRAAMGRAAAERAKAYDVERVLDRFEELYGSVVARASGR